jgi:hypothetical protein
MPFPTKEFPPSMSEPTKDETQKLPVWFTIVKIPLYPDPAAIPVVAIGKPVVITADATVDKRILLPVPEYPLVVKDPDPTWQIWLFVPFVDISWVMTVMRFTHDGRLIKSTDVPLALATVAV